MSERGATQTTILVLMIAIVLFLFTGIALVAYSLFQSGPEGVALASTSGELQIIPSSVIINEENKIVSFSIERVEGTKKIVGVKTILRDTEKREKFFDTSLTIQTGETRDLTHEYSETTLRKINAITIIAAYEETDGEVIFDIGETEETVAIIPNETNITEMNETEMNVSTNQTYLACLDSMCTLVNGSGTNECVLEGEACGGEEFPAFQGPAIFLNGGTQDTATWERVLSLGESLGAEPSIIVYQASLADTIDGKSVINLTKSEQYIEENVPTSGIEFAVLDIEKDYLEHIKDTSDPLFAQKQQEMVDLINLAKQLRPQFRWGYYQIPGMPFWINEDGNTYNYLNVPDDILQIVVDKALAPTDLIDAVDFTATSIYDPYISPQNDDFTVAWIQKKVEVSLQAAQGRPVFVYTLHRYSNGAAPQSEMLIENYDEYQQQQIEVAMNAGADGIFAWSADSYLLSIGNLDDEIPESFSGEEWLDYLHEIYLRLAVESVFGTPFEHLCGNGNIEPGEQCDDGNTQDGDGCSTLYCQIDFGWICEGEPSQCTSGSECADNVDNDGDGLIDHGEDPGCSDAGDNNEQGTLTCEETADAEDNPEVLGTITIFEEGIQILQQSDVCSGPPFVSQVYCPETITLTSEGCPGGAELCVQGATTIFFCQDVSSEHWCANGICEPL